MGERMRVFARVMRRVRQLDKKLQYPGNQADRAAWKVNQTSKTMHFAVCTAVLSCTLSSPVSRE